MPGFSTVFLATRPWSFPMTILVGVAALAYAAWRGAAIDWVLAGLAVAGATGLHAFANLVNDYYDWRRGVDRPGVGTAEYRPHPILHGILAPRSLASLAASLATASILAAATVSLLAERPLAIALAAAGLLLAFSYTGPPLALKYRGLGEAAVYLVWGLLIPLGVYYTATGHIDIGIAAYTAPLGLLVANVLLANNIRDSETDREAGVATLAARLGGKAATLFTAIVIAAYALPIPLVIAGTAPPTVLATLVTLPKSLKLAKELAENPPPDADPRAASIALTYATVYTVATIAYTLTPIHP